MRLSTTFTIAAMSTLSEASPLFILAARDPAPQSYSVVAVDGGSTASPVATRTTTNIYTLTQTSTVTLGDADHPFTTVVTNIIPTTIVQLVPVTETMTMVVEPSVTSVPFDNGQWHTTYYHRSTLSDVYIPVAASPTITAAPQVASAATASVSTATTTDWAHYYGSWQTTPKNGSWWGKRFAKIENMIGLLGR